MQRTMRRINDSHCPLCLCFGNLGILNFPDAAPRFIGPFQDSNPSVNTIAIATPLITPLAPCHSHVTSCLPRSTNRALKSSWTLGAWQFRQIKPILQIGRLRAFCPGCCTTLIRRRLHSPIIRRLHTRQNFRFDCISHTSCAAS